MSDRRRAIASLPRRVVGTAAVGVLAVAAVIAGVLAASASGTSGSSPARAFGLPAASSAPAGWHRATLAGGAAVLAYPPVMQLVSSDRGAASAAQLSSSGEYLLYLNATPKQGDESLRNWPQFRLGHLTDDDASSAHELATISGVRFLGGTGTCVKDDYVTKVGAHHFTEIACFVQGRTSASVIVAAAPTASWASLSGLLGRAIAGYVVR